MKNFTTHSIETRAPCTECLDVTWNFLEFGHIVNILASFKKDCRISFLSKSIYDLFLIVVRIENAVSCSVQLTEIFITQVRVTCYFGPPFENNFKFLNKSAAGPVSVTKFRDDLQIGERTLTISSPGIYRVLNFLAQIFYGVWGNEQLKVTGK